MPDTWAGWSTTAASNTPVGANTPNDLHDQLQNIKAQCKGNLNDRERSNCYAASAVGTDAYAITLTPALTAYANGQIFSFKADVANTGACTLNVNSLGAYDIKKYYRNALVALDDNDILANQVCVVVVDTTATAMIIINPTHGGSEKTAILQNRQTQNTSGGTATSGSWGIIPLNTEFEDPDSIVDSTSLPAFTLAAGTYRIEAICPFLGTNSSQIRLYNVTDAGVATNVNSIDMYGSSELATTGISIQIHSHLVGTFTLAASKQLRMEYYVSLTAATTGLGAAQNLGPEVFAQVKITKTP